MAKKRKAGPRTKSGRLSRAYLDPRVRDHGTPEAQNKRRALVGENGDPNLSSSVPGILYAHGYLDAQQYCEALEFARLRCILFGGPWPSNTIGSEPTEERIREIKRRFESKAARLTTEQESVITNVAAFHRIPNWFFALKLNLKMLPEDHLEQELLLSGINALLGRIEQKAA